MAALGAIVRHPVAFVHSVVNAESARYLYLLLRPTLFVPLLGDVAWIAGVPALFINLVSNKGWLRDVLQYYSLVPITFAFLAAARTASRLPQQAILGRRALIDWLTVLIAGATLFALLKLKKIPEPFLILVAALVGLIRAV